jgi:hypothetical protein
MDRQMGVGPPIVFQVIFGVLALDMSVIWGLWRCVRSGSIFRRRNAVMHREQTLRDLVAACPALNLVA